MENSFNTRVEKVFGSLQQNPPSISTESSPWSLTDLPVTRRDWKKGRDVESSCTSNRDELPCSSSFAKMGHSSKPRCSMGSDSEADEEEVGEDEDEDDKQEISNRRHRMGEEEWEISTSIGMDRTLDNEEEEDEFDRVAEGREKAGECLYMKDVIDQDPTRARFVDFVYGNKDPRANHMAANVRLIEDDGEDQNLNSELPGQSEFNQRRSKPLVEEVSGQPRSILKRKEESSNLKSNKKVKIDPSCKITCQEDIPRGTSESVFAANGVPDYLCNPSRYTRYSFDSSEMDEKSNCDAYLDFMKLINGTKTRALQAEDEMFDSGDISKAVTFIPRKKREPKEEIAVSKIELDSRESNHLQQTGMAADIAAEKFMESETGAMDEDGVEASVPDQSVRSRSRKYRTKPCYEEVE